MISGQRGRGIGIKKVGKNREFIIEVGKGKGSIYFLDVVDGGVAVAVKRATQGTHGMPRNEAGTTVRGGIQDRGGADRIR